MIEDIKNILKIKTQKLLELRKEEEAIRKKAGTENLRKITEYFHYAELLLLRETVLSIENIISKPQPSETIRQGVS